ncbi:OmpA family protein [Leptotrichia sp. OH3620_COT-345]|uniref:OmpA family protein n=1 Tax=Leptotrichia sp. OH3620_COT-345 TaxID=2491048 RepID=UPI000F64ECD9|nr:OmpA family protein [Leptotrichia sp. OH3620_COT-345]RRD38864.1 OmpA family protein [Leptotrichia sp. OH3620_COT-345]
MERKSRNVTIVKILSLLVISLSIFAEKKPSARQIREETLRINALELEEIDINAIKDSKGNLPREMTVVLSDETLKFGFNKDKVSPRYHGVLKNLIDYVTVNDYDVIVVGHTDSKGKDIYNMKLGLRRAENAKKKLLELGLTPDRIVGTESKGEMEPVASNNTEAGRALNRRIEFKLIKRN